MNVTLRQLQVFLAVAATRNFSRTGSQIGLTQPAVSRSITELEAQLGLQLLNRTTREVELTDCWRRSKFDPPCRLNFDPGLGAGIG